MPKGVEEYLLSCGLKNVLYSCYWDYHVKDKYLCLCSGVRQPSFSKVEPSREDLPKKRL
ncbi:hypothetical protein LguiB_017412 [Lonicera macranthoides]